MCVWPQNDLHGQPINKSALHRSQTSLVQFIDPGRDEGLCRASDSSPPASVNGGPIPRPVLCRIEEDLQHAYAPTACHATPPT